LAVAMFQDSSGAVAIRLGQCTPVATPTPTATPTPISSPAPPTLGDYPSSSSIQLSGNTTVMPNAAPTDTTSMSVSTTTSFKGTLAASPTTGVVIVTDAHPAGTYTVTVTAVGPAGTTAKTFALTVTGNPCGAGLTVGFTHATDVHTGNNPYSVAIGDFNRDGKQDLAIANVTNGGISIRLGDGLGGFSGLTGAASVGSPHSVAIGDLNGDGLQDLAVAAADIGGNIPIDLGDGLGGFSYIRNVTVGSVPWSIAIGDFNRDGKQDFAVANLFEATVSIRLGDGLGGFISPTEINEGGAAIAIGDFNGDGKQDLVLTPGPDIISIRLGDGLGGFSDPTHVSVASNPRSVAIGDFNGDGRPDLAVGNAGSGTVSIRLGDGSGDFSGSIEVTVGFSPSSIAIGDFNGDGIQDLAVANYDSDTVSIRLGDGTGGFSGSTEINVGANPSSVAVGDFNEDGVQDLAVANYLSYPGIVSILLGQCISAATPTPIPSPPAAAQSINLSTRMRVETGDSVAIGGFIITGKVPKRVIVRGIGPSLIRAGIANTLADPRMELHGPAGFTTIANENWSDTQEAEIIATGLAPTHNLEPAIVATLAPGGYTAIVGGGYEPTGVALVEVYDLDLSAVSKLTNISTRTPVNTGDEIVIGGFILGNGTMPDNIILRGIGPSLASFGVPNPLANPTLELRDLNGVLIRANDNWQADPAQAALIGAAGLAPTDNLESGIAATLAPGPYTALLSGVNGGTGVGLVEVYNLGAP
jgi:hypothetical protein